jgi:rhodanese-related sulfurtransferase
VPIVIVHHPDRLAGILWPALNIGYDNIVGELSVASPPGPRPAVNCAPPGWSPSEVDTPVVVDVRQADEHATGHLPGAHLVGLGSLSRAPTCCRPRHHRDVPTATATTGASLLERTGRRDLSILSGDAQDWAKATGRSLDTGR